MNQGAGRSERRLFERDLEAGAPSDGAGVAGLDALGLVARQQQDFLEHVVAGDFVDQRIEKRPAADRQHRLRRRFCSLSEACAEPAYENDGLF